jgi:DNA-binding SARP family transcriptional activator
VELRVLGPLEASAGGVLLSLGTRKQQVVLAMLALHTGRVVSLDQLVDELWGEHPPASAVGNVRGYAAGLRRLFGSVEAGAERIVRRGSGYVLHAEPDELDLTAFEQEVRQARAALGRGEFATAVAWFEAARARWRGVMLDGLPRGGTLTARCTAVEQDHLAAVEGQAEADLALGEADEAVRLLRPQIQAHPLREHPYALLMRAHYQAGDVGGALEVYAAARATLTEQLGIEPGTELQRLHHAVLNRDPELAEVRAAGAPEVPGAGAHGGAADHDAAAPPAGPIVVPRQLPAEVGCFVGRDKEAAQVRDVLAPADRYQRRRPAVMILYGPGGVGKSALAVRVAHELAEEFSHGQLYVDLFGSTPGLRPLPAVEVLGRLLRSLGIPAGDVPTTEADAAALFRSVTADRRLLLVLDNADDAGQVGGLLPGSGSCAVLVTSRQPLSTLDADGRLRIAGLPDADCLELLQRLSGELAGDTAATAAIVRLCDHLPLAIRIAAGRLIGRPDLAVREFAQRLADGQRRLDELQLDGLAVRACIGTGYEALRSASDPVAGRAAHVFRVLGVLNVPQLSAGVLGAMLDEPDLELVRAALDRLVQVQLLEPAGGGRYRLHDLVRLVAAECAETDAEADRELALGRAMAYYTDGLRRADGLLRPGRTMIFGTPPRVPEHLPPPVFGTPDESREWIDTELPSLVSAFEQACAHHGRAAEMTLWLGDLLWSHLHIRHEWQAALRISRLALDGGRRRRDRRLTGWAYLALGRSEANLGQLEPAAGHLTSALEVLRELDLPAGIALTLNALGLVADMRGDRDAALPPYLECLELARRHGMTSVQSAVLINISVGHLAMGRLSESMAAAQEAADIAHRERDLETLGVALTCLGALHCLRDEPAEAVRCADDALAWCQLAGYRVGDHELLITRSQANLQLGRYAEAAADAAEMLSLAQVSGDRYAEMVARRQQAKILAGSGRWSDAVAVRAKATVGYGRPDHQNPLIDALVAHHEPAWPAGETVVAGAGPR